MTQQVVLLGAARSGTKILRDALAETTGAGKVPYDIGYVWRIGNEGLPDDALPASAATDRTSRYIRRFVNSYAAGQHPSAVIEKTVGNTLRVPFVHTVLPDAVYVHLIRDGVDVIESTRRQWTAPTDLRYLARKARHFPLRLVPTYGVKYLRSVAQRRDGSSGHVGSWGPRYAGIDDDVLTLDLLTVCARQWRESVQIARMDLARLGLPVVEVRYEDLVGDPVSVLSRLAEFAGLDVVEAGMSAAARSVTNTRQGVGRATLTADELLSLDAQIGDLLARLGYAKVWPS